MKVESKPITQRCAHSASTGRRAAVAQSGSYLDEFACEVAEYDDINRTVRYSHPETQQDDAMHATNYALLVGIRTFPSNREMRMYG